MYELYFHWWLISPFIYILKATKNICLDRGLMVKGKSPDLARTESKLTEIEGI